MPVIGHVRRNTASETLVIFLYAAFQLHHAGTGHSPAGSHRFDLLNHQQDIS